MTEDTLEAEPTAGALAVQNIPSPEEARARWQAYVAMRDAVADDSDFQKFYDAKTKTTKRFAKKSLVKKIQTHLRVNVRVVSVDREDLSEGHFGYRCVAEASEPGGGIVQAVGGCSTEEERFDVQRYDNESDEKFAWRSRKALARSYHDVMATAETRATNRAVMNLVGGGEVTAEEVSREQKPADEPPKVEAPSVRELYTTFLKTGRSDEEWKAFAASIFGQNAKVLLEGSPDSRIRCFKEIARLKPVEKNVKTLDAQAAEAGLPLA